MNKRLRTIIIILAALVSAFAIGLYINTHRPIDRIPSDLGNVDNITFYALGDQGSGDFRQWEVSHAMENLAEKEHDLDFVVLMGDNFYTKNLSSIDSPEWMSKFEHVYSGTYLNATPFYAVLGNHDHGHSDSAANESDHSEEKQDHKLHPEVQIEYSKKHMGSNRWRMPDWYYSADFGKVRGQPLLRIVFLDTNLKHEDLLKEADFIRKQFSDPSKKPIWKIVIGHHPVRNYGKHHGEVDEMATTILQALQDAHVDLYLSGHDHNQQVIARDSEPFYFVNGGGGAKLYPIKKQPPDLIFARSIHGFVSLNMNENRLKIGLYDSGANALSSYKIERSCTQGMVRCLQSIPIN